MVKNTSGGSKTKSFARKLQHEVSAVTLRLPENEFEVVGCVYKMLGNGRMVVRTARPGMTEIQCVIRNKFRGRAKCNHMVSVGSFVLIGLYDWESPHFKSSDLLHVYASENVNSLKSNPALAVGGLDAFVSAYAVGGGSGAGVAEDFVFSSEEGGGAGDAGVAGAAGARIPPGGGSDLGRSDYDMDFDAI